MATLKARNERLARQRRARPASANAAGPTRHSRATHPAAVPAAGAARAAARSALPAQAIQDAIRVAQRERTEGDAADAPAHSAEECEAAPLPSATARARDAAAAASAGAAPARSAEQRESASMWLLAECERDGDDLAPGCLRHGMAAEDVIMSGGLHAFGTFDSISEPDNAPGNGPHADGACALSLAMLMSLKSAAQPQRIVTYHCCNTSVNLNLSKLLCGPQVALAAVLPSLSMPPLPRPLQRPRCAARPTSVARPRAMSPMPMRMAVMRRPRAGPASGTGPRRPGYPAVTRLSSRVRRWARLRRRHASLVGRWTRTVMRETRARHCASWACAARTRALRRRWHVSARTLPCRRAAYDVRYWLHCRCLVSHSFCCEADRE